MACSVPAFWSCRWIENSVKVENCNFWAHFVIFRSFSTLKCVEGVPIVEMFSSTSTIRWYIRQSLFKNIVGSKFREKVEICHFWHISSFFFRLFSTRKCVEGTQIVQMCSLTSTIRWYIRWQLSDHVLRSKIRSKVHDASLTDPPRPWAPRGGLVRPRNLFRWT